MFARVQVVLEHRDLSRDGDLGTWSSREASPFPREIERLQGLRVGEIAPPIDSPYGFQILLRTSVAERPLYAAARSVAGDAHRDLADSLYAELYGIKVS